MSVSKLVIKSYKDSQYASCTGEFSTQVNPTSIRISSKENYHNVQGMGGNSQIRYNTSSPEEMYFSLIFDDTGLIPSNDDKKSSQERVKALHAILRTERGFPQYIQVIWGELGFQGRLSEEKTEFVKFSLNGAVVRVKVDITLIGHSLDRSVAHVQASTPTTSRPRSNTPAQPKATGQPQHHEATHTQTAQHPPPSSPASSDSSKAKNAHEAAEAESEAVAHEQKSKKQDTTPVHTQNTTPANDPSKHPATDTTTKQPNNTHTHQVKEGESLSSINKQHGGDPSTIKKIAHANNLDGLRKLPPGTNLKIPKLPDMKGLVGGLGGLGGGLALAALLKKLVKAGKKGAKKVATKTKNTVSGSKK